MLTAVVVLPTPPFWLATAYTEPIRADLTEWPSAQTRAATGLCTQRALLRHPRAPRQLVRRGAAFSQHVQMAVPRARVRPHPADVFGLHRQFPGDAGELSLLIRVAAALPGHEYAVVDQEWRRQLGEGCQAADGSGRHRVVGVTPACAWWARGPLLGAAADNPGVPCPSGRYRALDELALAPIRLDQIYPRLRKRYGERQPGKAGARTHVRDRGRIPKPLHPQSGQGIVDVHMPGRIGIPHAARRPPVRLQRLDDATEGCAGVRRELFGAGGDAQSLSSGATTTQRSGSSPSLNVSIPARSFRCWWTTRRSVGVIGSSSISLPVFRARSAARSAWRSTASRRRSR